MRVISVLIDTGEFLFPLSLTQIIVYVIWGVLSSLFLKFLRVPLRYLKIFMNLDILSIPSQNANVKSFFLEDIQVRYAVGTLTGPARIVPSCMVQFLHSSKNL